MDKAAFATDKRTQQAGRPESAGDWRTRNAKLLEQHGDFVLEHPGIAWASMKGMRNRIAHGYFELDIGVVWEISNGRCPTCWLACPPCELPPGAASPSLSQNLGRVSSPFPVKPRQGESAIPVRCRAG